MKFLARKIALKTNENVRKSANLSTKKNQIKNLENYLCDHYSQRKKTLRHSSGGKNRKCRFDPHPSAEPAAILPERRFSADVRRRPGPSRDGHKKTDCIDVGFLKN